MCSAVYCYRREKKGELYDHDEDNNDLFHSGVGHGHVDDDDKDEEEEKCGDTEES